MALIRPMMISDYPGVMQLWQASSGMTLREADSEANIGAYLHKNPGMSFVALEQGAIVGAVLAGTDGRRGYLQHLAVQMEYRSQGIGRALTEAVVAALAAAGIQKTHLFVHAENESAQRFYAGLGWFPRDEVRMFSFNVSGDVGV